MLIQILSDYLTITDQLNQPKIGLLWVLLSWSLLLLTFWCVCPRFIIDIVSIVIIISVAPQIDGVQFERGEDSWFRTRWILSSWRDYLLGCRHPLLSGAGNIHMHQLRRCVCIPSFSWTNYSYCFFRMLTFRSICCLLTCDEHGPMDSSSRYSSSKQIPWAVYCTLIVFLCTSVASSVSSPRKSFFPTWTFVFLFIYISSLTSFVTFYLDNHCQGLLWTSGPSV